MTRTHGRALRGERLVAKVPYGRWRTLTFLAALRRDCIDAPCVIDGPINGESFLAYVEQFFVHRERPFLEPELTSLSKGCILFKVKWRAPAATLLPGLSIWLTIGVTARRPAR
jgi:hypothetical protein